MSGGEKQGKGMAVSQVRWRRHTDVKYKKWRPAEQLQTKIYRDLFIFPSKPGFSSNKLAKVQNVRQMILLF